HIKHHEGRLQQRINPVIESNGSIMVRETTKVRFRVKRFFIHIHSLLRRRRCQTRVRLPQTVTAFAVKGERFFSTLSPAMLHGYLATPSNRISACRLVIDRLQQAVNEGGPV